MNYDDLLTDGDLFIGSGTVDVEDDPVDISETVEFENRDDVKKRPKAVDVVFKSTDSLKEYIKSLLRVKASLVRFGNSIFKLSWSSAISCFRSKNGNLKVETQVADLDEHFGGCICAVQACVEVLDKKHLIGLYDKRIDTFFVELGGKCGSEIVVMTRIFSNVVVTGIDMNTITSRALVMEFMRGFKELRDVSQERLDTVLSEEKARSLGWFFNQLDDRASGKSSGNGAAKLYMVVLYLMLAGLDWSRHYELLRQFLDERINAVSEEYDCSYLLLCLGFGGVVTSRVSWLRSRCVFSSG